jgi:hypothetical protein
MATTFLDLVNIALRDINEVPLTSSTFSTPRGIQAVAKEMLSRAYLDILNYSKEWPFLSEKTGAKLTVATVALQPTYDFSTDVDNIDWDSFFIESTDSPVTYRSALQTIDIDFYTKHLKKRDLENSTVGGEPMFVYRLKSNDGFGISPYPDDRGYDVTFSAWTKPTILSAETDAIVFPEKYYNVLISRARYYIWMFRENVEQSQVALEEYRQGVKQMHMDLVNKQSIKMRAT